MEPILIDDKTSEEMELFGGLQGHKELIPFKGVLGGAPGYHQPYIALHKVDNNMGYVITSADDGHIGTNMLLYFVKNENAPIKWELFAYYMQASSEKWILNK